MEEKKDDGNELWASRFEKVYEPIKPPRITKGLNANDVDTKEENPEFRKGVSFRKVASVNLIQDEEQEIEERSRLIREIKDNASDKNLEYEFEQDLEELGVDEEHSGIIANKLLQNKYEGSQELKTDFLEAGLAEEEATKASNTLLKNFAPPPSLLQRQNSFVGNIQQERQSSKEPDCIGCIIL